MASHISIHALKDGLYVEGADDVLVVQHGLDFDRTDPRLGPVRAHIEEHDMERVYIQIHPGCDRMDVYGSRNYPELLASLYGSLEDWTTPSVAAAFRLADMSQPWEKL